MTTQTGKVLIILSDAHSFPVYKKDGSVTQEESGVFVMELAKPLAALLDAGYSVTFASPDGKGPNLDPISISTPLAFLGNFWEKRKELELLKRMEVENNFKNPRPFAAITDEELDTFDGVFVPGGHAPIVDLGDHPHLGRILWHFHNKRKATAVICHGPLALLSTKVAPNSPGFAYEGYNITSWSNTEESVVEKLKGGTVPKVEDALRDAGANMVVGTSQKFGSITVDRELVSGANPMAAGSLGEKFVEMLKSNNV